MGKRIKIPFWAPAKRAVVDSATREKLNGFKAGKSAAKKRGLSWEIEFHVYSQIRDNPCHYCGGALPPSGSGLDRIANEIGYIKSNVVPCCGTCNKARGNRYTKEEWQAMAAALLKHRNKGVVPAVEPIVETKTLYVLTEDPEETHYKQGRALWEKTFSYMSWEDFWEAWAA